MDILVVEDDAALRRTVTTALRSCGHNVVDVETGAAALACMDTCPPHLVVLDLQLPEMDGREFLRMLHANPHSTSIPVLVMSAEPGPTASQLGVQAFVDKPFDLDDLLDTAELLLRTSHAAATGDP